jgi:hypothetical protein
MKQLIILLAIITGNVHLFAQQSKLDPNVPVLRKQVFSEYTPLADVRTYAFDTSSLVAFSNGFIVSHEEFIHVFNSAVRKDSSLATKTKFLDEYILGRQRMFEAFEQNLDTATEFQLEFLKYKQNFITPYLNEGYTRVEAEALPEVKYSLRAHYSGMILFELMMKEVWMKANSEADQKTFFYAHPELYQGQPFGVSKTKVVFDYQKELESSLNSRVQSKFTFAKNEKLATQL